MSIGLLTLPVKLWAAGEEGVEGVPPGTAELDPPPPHAAIADISNTTVITLQIFINPPLSLQTDNWNIKKVLPLLFSAGRSFFYSGGEPGGLSSDYCR